MSSSTIIVEGPGRNFTVEKPDCIGAYYILYVTEWKLRVLATCIDATPAGRPKRMRVQRNMAHGGEVVEPGQYDVLEKDPQWED